MTLISWFLQSFRFRLHRSAGCHVTNTLESKSSCVKSVELVQRQTTYHDRSCRKMRNLHKLENSHPMKLAATRMRFFWTLSLFDPGARGWSELLKPKQSQFQRNPSHSNSIHGAITSLINHSVRIYSEMRSVI